jgi:ATPase
MKSKREGNAARIIADTSVIIDGRVSEFYADGKTEVLIPKVVVQELEHQANTGRNVGKEGLRELEQLQGLSKSKKILLSFVGEALESKDIKSAHLGRIDEIIRELARENDATLVTSDKTQASVARVYDIPCEYYEPALPEAKNKLALEGFFDKNTMSVHLKEGVPPYAKKGRPGAWELVPVGKKPLEKSELDAIIDELIEESQRERGLIEIDRKGCTVIQMGSYRIVITKFPFSEASEITAVRPITTLHLKDYPLSEKLKKRLEGKAEGVLVVGPPGAGKSTFAQALAEFYTSMGKTVKTMEHPRDLQVPPGVTQYGPLDGSMKNTGDILLLVRPDYTIYDELRKANDFVIFEDLRLAGVGMVGVAHGAAPIDAIQRFVGKVELGVIPQVVDTLLFIKAGQVSTVYTLNMSVKTPTGMTEADLARPVVEVKDFESGDLEYEIYTYGEQVVVIPVKQVAAKHAKEFAKISEGLEERILGHVPEAEIENVGKNVNVFVPQKFMKRLIGRGGQTITGIEREFGVSINVMPLGGSGPEVHNMGKNICIDVGKHNAGQYLKLYADKEALFSSIANRKGEVVVKRGTKNGRRLSQAISSGKEISCEPAF